MGNKSTCHTASKSVKTPSVLFINIAFYEATRLTTQPMSSVENPSTS